MNIKKIIEFSEKPELYERGTAVMWTDEYISEQLLAVHLNENIDLASRKKDTIDNTVNWILDKIRGNNLTVLDLGCGPGLYTERFAEAGHKVTGVDFSKNSIDYAAKESAGKNLNVSYINKNYLELDFENEFDLVTLIYTDFGVLLPHDRETLLKMVTRALKPGGIFIFDVLNDKNLESKLTPKNWQAAEKGFWMNKPHIVFSNSFLYEEEKVILYQHFVTDEKDNTNIYRFWTHFFSDEDLKILLQKSGFENMNMYKDVLPQSCLWDGDNVTFCVSEIMK